MRFFFSFYVTLFFFYPFTRRNCVEWQASDAGKTRISSQQRPFLIYKIFIINENNEKRKKAERKRLRYLTIVRESSASAICSTIRFQLQRITCIAYSQQPHYSAICYLFFQSVHFHFHFHSRCVHFRFKQKKKFKLFFFRKKHAQSEKKG